MTSPPTTDWGRALAVVGEGLARSELNPDAVGVLDGEAAGEDWAVALSGGADSVLLVLAVLAHWPQRRGRIVALHFNHRLRGEASEADAGFCRDLSSALGLRFVVGEASWKAGSAISEAQARVARFDFFERELHQAGIRSLLLGHQREDIAETLLMRLARGSGTGGLAAPRPVHRHGSGRLHLRPLLSVGRDRIRSLLSAAGVAWRDDASNREGRFLRNRIRSEVLPAWARVMPEDLFRAVARSRELLQEDDDALGAWLDAVVPPGSAGEVLSLQPLHGLPRALWRRALHRWLGERGLGEAFSREGFQELLEAAMEGRQTRFSAGSERFVRLSGQAVRLEDEGAGQDDPEFGTGILPLNAEVWLPTAMRLAARRVPIDAGLRDRIRGGGPDPAREAFLAWDSQPAEFFRVRFWRDGDRFRPLGFAVPGKLHNLFINAQIPRHLRRRLPLVTLPEGNIVWIPGFPPGEELRIGAETKMGVQLTYDADLTTLPASY